MFACRVVAPCRLIVYKSEAPIALMMEAVRTSDTSVASHQSTRRYNPAGGHLLCTVSWRTNGAAMERAAWHCTARHG
jgi:hypothetical protein